MKKVIMIVLVSVVMLSIGAVALAETANETPEWFKGMIEWRKDQIQEAVESEEITEEQARYWNERIDAMEKFHEENGFNPGGGGCGFGRGQGRGFKRGNGRGFGGSGMQGWFNRTDVDSGDI